MLSPVSFINLRRLFCIHSCQKCRRDHQNCRYSGWQIIKHVIHLCRHSPEIKIFFVLISQHRIHRIDRFIEESKRCTAKHQKHQRRSHTIGCIFCHSFHCCLCNPFFCKRLGISSYNHGNCFSCPLHILCFQSMVYLLTFHRKGTCRQDLVTPEAFQKKRNSRVDLLCRPQHQTWNPCTDQNHQDPQNSPCHNLFFR